jgi:hypothetical protein
VLEQREALISMLCEAAELDGALVGFAWTR